MLVIVCGLQGVGKSTVAQRIAAKMDALLLRTDVIRKELIGKPDYSEQEMQRIYDEMFARALKSLQQKKHVVLDATFTKQSNRVQAKKVAQEVETGFKIVEVTCLEDEVQRRIEKRSGDASEARFREYLKYKFLFEPIVEEHISINNSGSVEDIDKQIKKVFE
jgi:predicted kinase